MGNLESLMNSKNSSKFLHDDSGRASIIEIAII